MPGGGYLDNTLLHRVATHEPNASPLHRLGRHTSGIVLFARSGRERARLCELWQRGDVVRRYRALVSGLFPAGEDVSIDVPIGPVPHAVLGSVAGARPSSKGKPARTKVRLLEQRPTATAEGHLSLVEVEILTGRTHQIRIHLAAAGFPLVGDPLYPTGGVPSPNATALPGEGGFWLHAGYVCLPRARRDESESENENERLIIECVPPEALRQSA
jgi:23S rRNA pseudouridine1911/1915/1917 synthase